MERTIPITLLCAVALFTAGAQGQQASITLKNSDVSYCHKQEASWMLAKTNDSGYPATVNPGSTVNWTVAATRGANGPEQICAIGFVSITNTGSAPAPIGNIVVDLQRKMGQPNKWTVISADVADATNGDAATSANILANALQNQTVYPAAIVTLNGVAATFNENSVSENLSFTDADSNTIWAITPGQTLAVGATVNLFFNAVFNAGAISFNPNESLRTEVFVSFADAGSRGKGRASGGDFDVNGDGVAETNIRTVPTRVAKALPELQICNNTVTVTDTFAQGPVTVSLSADPIGASVTTSTSQTYVLTGTVDGSGLLANTAELKGTGTTVTLTLGSDPVTQLPITKTLDCCVAVDLTANSNVAVLVSPPPGHCSYTKGAFNPDANGAPAGILVANFATYFPASNGLLIGTQPAYWAQWTPAGLAHLRQWLKGGGSSGTLTANTINATSTAGGDLAKQVAALTINLAFGANNVYMYSGIGNLILTDTGSSLDGQSVNSILAAANTALGGGAMPSGYTFGTLNDLITSLNQSFDNCAQSTWATLHLQ